MRFQPLKVHSRTIVTVIVVTSTVLACYAAPSTRTTKDSVPKGARCAMCGMLVARFQNWVASITFKGGATTYFDGPKCMFGYYANPSAVDPGKKRSDFATMTVRDYYSLKPIEARKAYFVTGSDVLGPMGAELVPFVRRSDAAGFKKDHHGKRVLAFSEVTPAVVRAL